MIMWTIKDNDPIEAYRKKQEDFERELKERKNWIKPRNKLYIEKNPCKNRKESS